ncbi:MAG: hypothetical protein Q9182_006289 [Xanthomendoza sp. 2 TL-2023]
MADAASTQQDRAQAEAEADVVSRHLPSGYTAEPTAFTPESGNDASHSSPDPASPPEPQDSLRLQGGDIHREIFKIGARAKLGQRAATFAQPNIRRSSSFVPRNQIPASEQRAPGGFRRQFVQQQRQIGFNAATAPITRNFVSFLALYGSFAGEDLAESDDSSLATTEDEAETPPTETRPLLGRRKSTRRPIPPGDAGMTKSFFTLLKAFIGTGIMFLPKAFKNGGILFSSITLITVALLSCLSFHLLLRCRQRYGGGYGEIGAAIGGSKLRSLILASITLSQIGFVCSGIIFIAQNLRSFLNAVSPGPTMAIGTKTLIAVQLVVLIPLALIRDISRLGPAALVADIFIFIGLFYIWYYDIFTLATSGMHPTVQLFNPRDFTLTIGSAIFTFEGIGLILPIQSSMAEPSRFPRLLYIVMIIITIIFTSVGALCYATFGYKTRVEIISNYPQTSKLVNSVQFLYSLAVLVGTPVQLFPATRIIETKIFGDRASGKKSPALKWKKNAFRTAITVLCGLISILGASDLDKFVALIGAFACVPLVYIYPAFLHWKGVARSPWVKGGDILLCVLGLGAMIYSTAVTISTWVRQ